MSHHYAHYPYYAIEPGNIKILYVPCPSQDVAQELANLLLEEQLCACVNIFPITSYYKEDGNMVDASEYVMIIKTRPGLVRHIKRTVEKHHPYDIPAIITLYANANTSYYRWLIQMVRPTWIKKLFKFFTSS